MNLAIVPGTDLKDGRFVLNTSQLLSTSIEQATSQTTPDGHRIFEKSFRIAIIGRPFPFPVTHGVADLDSIIETLIDGYDPLAGAHTVDVTLRYTRSSV